jgi:trehalose-6-phosphate synthase
MSHLGWKGINPRTSEGLQTLASVIGQWEPTPVNQALRNALAEASSQMKRQEDALKDVLAEYEGESWTEDTQSEIAALVHGEEETPT